MKKMIFSYSRGLQIVSLLLFYFSFLSSGVAIPTQLTQVPLDDSQVEKVGLFMGTFDPIHYGHINVALNAKKEAGLDRVILIPNFDAPHKPKAVSGLHRLNMTRLAAQDHEELQVIEPELFSYLFQLKLAKGTQAVYKHFLEILDPQTLVFQISGSDIIDRYGHQIDAIQINHPRLNILLTHRPDEGEVNLDFVAEFQNKIIQLVKPSPEISSTFIRKQLGQNYEDFSPLSGLLDPAVVKYILENKLYAPEADMNVSKLESVSFCSEALMPQKVSL